jgi:2Fe-2S ferredoxin
MQRREKTIAIFVRKDNMERVFFSYPNEYRNLMELLNDKLYMEDFGECKGVGRCGTCCIRIESMDIPISGPERNEQTTLTRSSINLKNTRLACQILIDTSIDGLRLEVILVQ